MKAPPRGRVAEIFDMGFLAEPPLAMPVYNLTIFILGMTKEGGLSQKSLVFVHI